MIRMTLQLFASKGRSKERVVALNDISSERSVESVADDEGNNFAIADMSEVPNGYNLVMGHAIIGKWDGESYGPSYAVFAPNTNGSADLSEGVAVRLSASGEAAAINIFEKYWKNPTSSQLNYYINKYDNPNASQKVKEKVAAAYLLRSILQKFGL